jgi:ankyrin repeat protein
MIKNYNRWVQIVLAAAALQVLPVLCQASEIQSAAKSNDVAKVQSLLKKNPGLVNEVSKGGVTPLHWAARGNAALAARVLINAGADIEAKTDTGSTPLHWAANQNATDMIKLLINAHAQVNTRANDGSTPLHWAVVGNAPDAVALLLKRGAEVNGKTNNGSTPLHLAAQKDNLQIIQALIQNGADIYLKDADGHTSLYWVKSSRAREIFEQSIAAQDQGGEQPPPEADIALAKTPDAGDTASTSSSGTRTMKSRSSKGPNASVVRWRNGTIYEGDWVNETMDGQGTLTFSNGERYEGQWVHALKQGNGVYVFQDGEKYDGQWMADKRSGSGVYTIPDGGRFEGTWSNGHLEQGFGLYHFANGDTYEGEWRNDKMSGTGIYTTSDGRKYDGQWEANRFVSGTTPDQSAVAPEPARESNAGETVNVNAEEDKPTPAPRKLQHASSPIMR